MLETKDPLFISLQRNDLC
uniref:Uncharacterized protein n=1 Tax=Arundo donax TaxID=35708 RepID=A0A0A8YGG0_ARUDO